MHQGTHSFTMGTQEASEMNDTETADKLHTACCDVGEYGADVGPARPLVPLLCLATHTGLLDVSQCQKVSIGSVCQEQDIGIQDGHDQLQQTCCERHIGMQDSYIAATQCEQTRHYYI